MSLAPLLEIQGLVTSLQSAGGRVRAVDGLSLSVARGQAVCVAGESGCGKSVTALSVMGLLPDSARIEAGAIRLAGADLLALPPGERRRLRGRAMAMVFQEPATALNPVQTIGRQVAEGFAIHATASRAQARERTLALLRRVGIADADRRVDDYPHQFSGGMKQRVLIAMALANRPALLVADEPTTALDPGTQAQVLQLLRELQHEHGMGLLFVTHDLDVVAGIADRVAVMVAGRVVEEGAADVVLRRPAHPYTAGLLAARPRPGQTRRGGARLAAIPGASAGADAGVDAAGCRYRPRCPHAQPRCAHEAPALAPRTPGHAVACHFPLAS
jgi:peptide/nickel transport system ATP-binding protein